MDSLAVVMEAPGRLSLRPIALKPLEDEDLLVEIAWSGISTGTERLLWTGRMPPFPGLGYPLVPGYESVGTVIDAGSAVRRRLGERVFVPGSSGFAEVRGLFGGAARRLVVASQRVASLGGIEGEQGVLLALAATATHALSGGDGRPADLIVGHGVLGRLLARIAVARGGAPPTVWETNPLRLGGAQGYEVMAPDDDPRRDYRSIYDVSGDSSLIGPLIERLARGGEVVLAGFYDQDLRFAFPPAFMREARIRVAAEWAPVDLEATLKLIASQALCLDGLITHKLVAEAAEVAYRTAFTDPSCLKMVLDWQSAP